MTDHVELKPFQRKASNEIDWLGGRALVALDMGLGKTLLSLYKALILWEATPVIVVCPANVKYHWAAEARRVKRVELIVLEGRRGGCLPRSADVVIVNYDVLKGWVPHLRALRPRCIVIDECHYIANPQAKRTKAIRELCKGIHHVLALSGTPLINRPIELYPTLNILNPRTFPSKLRFAHRYCNPHLTPWGWDYQGASNTEELHELLFNHVMVRYRKRDVLDQLPPKSCETVELTLSDPKEYQLANKDFLAWLAAQDTQAARRASRAEQVTKTGYLLRLSAMLKLQAVTDWVKSFLVDSDEKLVLFYTHRRVAQRLEEEFHGMSLRIDGSVTGKDRHQAVDRFIHDSQIRLLLGNIQAAGIGIDGLQWVCSSAAFVELPWQPGALRQAEDRLWRMGASTKVDIYYLVAYNTVEGKLCRILRDKQSTVSSILDGDKSVDDLSVFDQLIKEMRTSK